MRKYKSCEICSCDECKSGRYRHGSWLCPVLRKRICSTCCRFDADAEYVKFNGRVYYNFRSKCKKIKCVHLDKPGTWKTVYRKKL